MEGLYLVIILAITVEALVEYTKTIYDAVSTGAIKTVVLQACAILLAIALCFAINADLYKLLGIVFEQRWVGILLTGIFASRGANFVSDFVGKLQRK